MRLYRLVHRLSLVAGPLLLLDGDFPAPRGMPETAASTVERVMSAVPAG